MGIAFARDDSANKAPAEVYNWRIYFLAVSAAMGSAMFGYDSAFIGGALSLPRFATRFGLATSSGTKLAALKANIVSTFQAGCFFGAIFVYYITEKLGRRLTLILCGVLFNIGAIIQLASSGRVGMIYGGRVLTGLAVGASSLLIPVYISECSPPAIRGRLVGIFECMLQLFQVVGFWINYGVNLHISETSDAQWQIPFGFQLVPATLLIIFMCFQPESPRWLVKNDQLEKASSCLSTIRNLPADHEYIRWEVSMVQQQIEHENVLGTNNSLLSKLKETFSTGVRGRLFLGIALMIFQNLSGINALNYYSPTIFKSIGFTGTSVGLLATGVFGIVKATVTTIFMFIGIDRIGRRNAMLIGSVGAMVALYYVAGYTAVSHSFISTHVKRDGGAYVAILMIYVFAVFYAMSWNGIPWVFCSEVFPTGIRSICLVFTTCSQWLGQFIIVYSTPYMMTSITYGTFLFFASSVLVGAFMIWLFMPETKGLSMEEMDILFSQKGSPTHKRKETERIIAERITDGVNGSNIDGKGDLAHVEQV